MTIRGEGGARDPERSAREEHEREGRRRDEEADDDEVGGADAGVERGLDADERPPDHSTTISPSARWARRLDGVRIGGILAAIRSAGTMWRLLPIMAVLLVACGGGSAPSAPLASGAVTSEAIGVATGSPATWAGVVLVNRGTAPLTLSAVEPVSLDAGLKVAGVEVRVLGPDGDALGDPNPSVSGPGYPPESTAACRSRASALALRSWRPTSARWPRCWSAWSPTGPGRYVLRGLRVRYTVGGSGAARGRSRTPAANSALTDPDDQAGTCTPP